MGRLIERSAEGIADEVDTYPFGHNTKDMAPIYSLRKIRQAIPIIDYPLIRAREVAAEGAARTDAPLQYIVHNIENPGAKDLLAGS